MPLQPHEIILIIKHDRFVYSNELTDHHFFMGDPAKFDPPTIVINKKYYMFPEQPQEAEYSFSDVLTALKNQQKGE